MFTKAKTLLMSAQYATHLQASLKSRLLKKHTGKNFKELLKEQKLKSAAALLEESNMSDEDIMTNVGYENSSFFYRIFREKYGCSPKEYRCK